MPQPDYDNFVKNAGSVAALLKALANQKRLMVLCKLAELGSASPGALSTAVGLSQSALSQHLAKMRQETLVTFERKSQTLHYRINDPRLATLLNTLHDLYCADNSAMAAKEPK